MKLRRGLKTCGIGFAVLLCALAAFLSYKPPLLDGVSFSQAVYASDGSLMRLSLAKDDTYRLRVPLNRISPLLQQGVLLHEDQRFHEHFGINPASLGRAFMQTYFSGGRRVGASTISMQLARIKFKLHTRSVPGKLWQMLRALQIELHYTKPEILEAYLNLAPYGRNIEGVGAASLIYFGRKAEALTLPEALTLAVIPQSPARRAPRAEDANNAPLIAARNRLFARWKETHPEDVAQSLYFALPLKTRSPEQLPFRAPHTVWSLLKRFPGQSEIVSTIDPRAQNLLENLVGRYVQANRYIGVTNASAMLVDFRSMQVVASVGSADYFNASIFGQVDGTQAKRSPGSALKPFIYALAFEQGLIQPMSLLQDAPASFGE